MQLRFQALLSEPVLCPHSFSCTKHVLDSSQAPRAPDASIAIRPAELALHVADSAEKGDVNTASSLRTGIDTRLEVGRADRTHVAIEMVNAALDGEANTVGRKYGLAVALRATESSRDRGSCGGGCHHADDGGGRRQGSSGSRLGCCGSGGCGGRSGRSREHDRRSLPASDVAVRSGLELADGRLEPASSGAVALEAAGVDEAHAAADGGIVADFHAVEVGAEDTDAVVRAGPGVGVAFKLVGLGAGTGH